MCDVLHIWRETSRKWFNRISQFFLNESSTQISEPNNFSLASKKVFHPLSSLLVQFSSLFIAFHKCLKFCWCWVEKNLIKNFCFRIRTLTHIYVCISSYSISGYWKADYFRSPLNAILHNTPKSVNKLQISHQILMNYESAFNPPLKFNYEQLPLNIHRERF